MEKKIGYRTITYRFRLYCEHKDWLLETQKIYSQVLEFYYQVLEKETEVAEIVSKQKQLRQLELLTIGARGQDKSTVEYPIPYEKIPLYFRRAAANDAIRMYRSDVTRQEKGMASSQTAAKKVQASPIFYKGMYRNFTEFSIELKLWNGEKWTWEQCEIDTCGYTFPKDAQILSPILKIGSNKVMLHIPIQEEVSDVRTVRERLKYTERICAVAFPGGDCMAVLAILDKDGNCQESLFIRGGKQFAHEKKKLLNRICKNRASMGLLGEEVKDRLSDEENKYLKEKIKNLSDTYAHKVSRQIVDFCEKQNIEILVVPNYRQTINLNQMGYLKATSYDWIGRRIIQYLRYKAFGEGMVVTSVGTKHVSSKCHICGAEIQRYNKNHNPSKNYYGGKNYICPNGHKGNSYFNTAMNVGLNFLKSQ